MMLLESDTSSIVIYSLWGIYAVICCSLLIYGLNNYVLITGFLRKRKQAKQTDHERELAFQVEMEKPDFQWPKVVTQLPIYNEVNVAERIIRAAANIDYPTELHEIQVLDDSNDETVQIIDETVAELRSKGVNIQVIRRDNRSGYKAGALKEGMTKTDGEFFAVFDSDFVPEPNFIRKALPHLLTQPDVGLVQCRWGHLNANESWLTRSIAVGIDGHFGIEQSARCWNDLFLNFNGTCGIWKREAIERAGGWEGDTLTEDLDLSYRSQLKGWKIHYLFDVVVPAELPNSFTAFKSQQFRWAKGSIQTALKLMPTIFRGQVPLFKKIQSWVHLTHYALHLLMTLLAIVCLPLLLIPEARLPAWIWIAAAVPIGLATLGPSMTYLFSQHAIGSLSIGATLSRLPGLILLGFGISLSNANAVMQALMGKQSGFVRTPKRGSQSVKSYSLGKTALPWLEVALGLYCLFTLGVAFVNERLALGPFIVIYAIGYSVVGIASLRETRLKA